MAIRIVVSGATGRMGRAVGRLAAGADDLELVGGLARTPRDPAECRALGYPRITTVDQAAPLLETADVVVDLSAPDQLHRILDTQAPALAGRAVVVGTTGLDEATRRLLERQAERSAVLAASNFSIGVNLLLALVEEAARRLDDGAYDVEIVEAHHRRKADAPSGTALSLGEAVARARSRTLEAVRRDGRSGRTGERRRGEIGFHAVRGGEVPGEHRVLFLGARERLELAHTARDRSLFAEGALAAARWVADRPPGRYTMRQVLGG